MKEKYVRDLKPNDDLSGEIFRVSASKKNETKSGGEYYRMELSDKSGSIVTMVWSDSIPNCPPETLVQGAIVKVWGKIEDYKGLKQVKVTSLGIAEEYDASDFIKVSERDPEEMWKEFGAHIKGMENEHIKNLLTEIFSDADIKKRYQEHPAATSVHHAFKHGLLEHVMEMLDLSEVMLRYYPLADGSLVKAGCILHDIGKLYEISDDGMNYDKTTPGLLLGHIMQGYEFLIERAPEDFPQDLLLKLKHIILSHHGILEYGSPVTPMCIEAIIVSKVDDTSAHTRQFQRILKDNEGSQEEFSEYDKLIGGRVLLK